MRIIKPFIVIAAAAIAGWGCTPDTPSKSSVESYPGELSKAKYDALTDEQKYQVSNKLLGTMFKGMPVDEFFDISNGMSTPALKDGANLLADTKASLSTELTQDERVFYDAVITDLDDERQSDVSDEELRSMFRIDFNSSNSTWPKQLPLARMYTYPLSKDTFDAWVAYVLANTILFSPAEEIDSTSIRDVQKVFTKLREDLRNDRTIREIIARHQRTQENWRRFRSPEDNTREMIEIYLGLFDRDADVPKAAKACQDLYLTDDENNYELLSTGFINTEPQYVLDTFVVTCDDFYDTVASHPLVIPRVTTVLVEYFFYNKSGEERAAIVNRIVSGNPTTFQDIFKSILFSEEYLINNERARSSEETFFSTAHQMDWKPYRTLLSDMSSSNINIKMSMQHMGWPIMSLKLGRFTGVPLDSLSFGNYHKGIREYLLLGSASNGNNNNANGSCSNNVEDFESRRSCRWKAGMGLELRNDLPATLPADATESVTQKYQYEMGRITKLNARYDRVMSLSLNDFIDYVFMTAVQRRASTVERNDLIAYYTTRNFLDTDATTGETIIRDGRHDEIAQVALDYISRLPEYYYFQQIN